MAQDKLNGMPSPVAHCPEECNRLLLAALETGDIEASVQLYEPGAVLFVRSGELLSGHMAIRDNNAKIIALKPTFYIEKIVTTINAEGDIATTRMKARLEGSRADGRRITSELHTLEVQRKQADGSWRYVIDDPFGSMRAQLDNAEAA
jgi:ketosteroid isomerase-like protein